MFRNNHDVDEAQRGWHWRGRRKWWWRRQPWHYPQISCDGGWAGTCWCGGPAALELRPRRTVAYPGSVSHTKRDNYDNQQSTPPKSRCRVLVIVIATAAAIKIIVTLLGWSDYQPSAIVIAMLSPKMQRTGNCYSLISSITVFLIHSTINIHFAKFSLK